MFDSGPSIRVVGNLVCCSTYSLYKIARYGVQLLDLLDCEGIEYHESALFIFLEEQNVLFDLNVATQEKKMLKIT
jgi:hypothetical protein